ncbi:MAG: aminotransferase class V-fold PLP-dependent enzyme, partial [Parvularculaceae bacterium]|nr:aminotransferase class V-fold PLP-dependent enzyme [Parvularculaceae bacterium]
MTARKEAEALDRADPLAPLRAAFAPLSGVYCDGHSLGPPTRAALERLQRTATEDWAGRLVGAWNEGADGPWISLPERTGAKIARLVGVAAEDVVVADSVSVNIFKLAGALARPGDAVAVVAGEFPTDSYVVEGLARLTGARFIRLGPDDPLAGRGIGVVVRSLVDYRTARVVDMARAEAEARAAGVALVWDLSHATGLLALDLEAAGARYAVGCGYKYLNGGPGAPAFLYCRGDAAARLETPIAGWFGHAAPFDFATAHASAPGARRFLAGTPPVLSLAALDASLDLFDGIDMAAVEAKAARLSEIFLAAAAPLDLDVVSPREGRRGGHVALRSEDGY